MVEPRIALFTGNYNHVRDGVSQTLNRMVSFLESKGIAVRIFGPTIDEPAIPPNGDFVAVPSKPMSGTRSEYRITNRFPSHVKRAIKEFKPNLIHIATPDYLGFRALIWAKIHGIPVVSSYHTHFTSYAKYYDFDFLEGILWRFLRWFYNQGEHLYVPSESMAEVLATKHIKKGIRIWARGVETELYNPEKRDMDWRRSVGFSDDEIVVTFVSRLVWEKELKTFARAVNKVKHGNPKVSAMIVGDGPALERLKKMLPYAHFTGFIKGDELARAYASSDVFFFPSHTETFGNVTLEAMSSGLPCLVANATGSKSLVEDGVNGCLGKIKDVVDFTEKLKFITDNDELRLKMGKASREKAMDYRWEIINNNLLGYYHEVLNPGQEFKGH